MDKRTGKKKKKKTVRPDGQELFILPKKEPAIKRNTTNK